MDDDSVKNRLRQALAHLTAIGGVSGHEQQVVAYLRQAMAPLVDTIEVDALGNLYATRRGQGPHLMVSAHSDEIGALVAEIDSEGFLRLQAVGGVSAPMLMARKVRVRDQLGVIGVRPGHFGTAQTAPEIEDLYVDLGLSSREEVAALGITVGDQIVWQSELERTANPDRVVGKAIDNRIGCLVLLELLQSLRGEDLPGTLTVVIAVQEETGLKGAGVAANRLRPDAALVVDTVPCADTPDTRHVHGFPVGIGRGPVFQVSSARHAAGFLMAESVRDFLIAMARQAAIPYQLAAFSYGNTDASAVYTAGGGIATGVATMPRRYSHSPVEMLDLNDAAATLRLCGAVVRNMREFPRGLMG